MVAINVKIKRSRKISMAAAEERVFNVTRVPCQGEQVIIDGLPFEVKIVSTALNVDAIFLLVEP